MRSKLLVSPSVLGMIDLLGADLSSLDDLPDLDVSARSLNLHMNRLRSAESLQRFTELEELILSSNAVVEMRGLESLTRLRILDLSCNELRHLSSLAGLVSLDQLHVAYNRLETLEGLQQLWGKRYRLRILDLRYNRVCSLSQLLFIGGCTCLEELRLQGGLGIRGGRRTSEPGNPVCAERGYRLAALRAVPGLHALDDIEVGEDERQHARDDGTSCNHATSSNAAVTIQALGEEEERALLEPQMSQLGGRVAGVVEALEVRMSSPTVTNDLLAEILSELSSLREVDVEATEAADIRLAERRQEARLRVGLAEIAVELQRREERHAAAEHELGRATEVLNAEEASARYAASEVEAEGRREAELHAELGVERASASEHEAVERRVSSALLRLMQQGSAPGFVVDLPALRRELSCTASAIEDARCKLRRCAEAMPALRASVRAIEERLACEVAAAEERREHVNVFQTEAQELRRETGEQAGLLADAATLFACQERQRRMALGHEEACVRQLRDHSSRLHREAESYEEEAGRIAASLDVATARRELEDERETSAALARDGMDRCTKLESRLEVALEQAEDAVRKGAKQWNVLEQKVEQQRLVARMAGDQENLGGFVVAQLSLELQQSRCEEGIEFREAEEIDASMAEEERMAACLLEDERSAEERTRAVCLATKTEYVPRSAHAECLASCFAAFEDSASLTLLSRSEGQALRALLSTLEGRREVLSSLREELVGVQTNEHESRQSLKLKTHMVVHAREDIAQRELQLRRADVTQSERDSDARRRCEEASITADEWRDSELRLEESVDDMRQQADRLEQSIDEKEEAIGITEEHLGQMRSLHARREEVARAQVLRLRDQSAKVLAQARCSMEEMERDFKSERCGQQIARDALRAELSEARQRLVRAPQNLQETRRRIALERARSAEQVSALLVGLRG